MFRAAWDAGVRYYDTAPYYGMDSTNCARTKPALEEPR